MSVLWTVLGTVAQLLLALFMFIMAVVIGASIGNNTTPGKLPSDILNLALYVLPGLCVASAAGVIVLHLRGGSAASYGWYALPLVAAVLYVTYAVWLQRQG